MTNELERYWNDIPIGAENAVPYMYLCMLWDKSEREVRRILHKLSLSDNGDNYIIIRSGHGKGFYKSDDEADLIAYKKECLNKGRSNFAPIKKINRILKGNAEALQTSIHNNIKAVRLSHEMSQPTLCDEMSKRGCPLDVPTLSKMENGVFIPHPFCLSVMAQILACEPSELVNMDLAVLDIYAQN